jgi:hypothetical protein
MKKSLLISGLMALAIPGAALAQPYDPGCVRSNQNNQVAGTVLGALGGALLGNAIAGRGHKEDGAIVGGLGGAVAGNVIAGSRNNPCPAGYYYAPPPAPPPPPPPPPPRRDFWYGGPQDIHDRIEFLQDRIHHAIDGGWLSPREVDRINDEMHRIRDEDRRLEYQDYGHLRPEDREYLQGLLDNLSQRLHWAEHNDR